MRSLSPVTVAAVERSRAAGHNTWLVAERVDNGKRDAYGNVYVPVLLDHEGGKANWFVVRIERDGTTIVTNTGAPFHQRSHAYTHQHALASGNLKDWPR